MTPTLESKKLVDTAEKISSRIAERFPQSGLSDVAVALVAAARDTSDRAAAIARPNRWIRAGQVLLVVIAVAGVVAYFQAGIGNQPFWKAALEFLDTAKANAALLVATGVFLFTLETRAKRRRALRAAHELRALAHLIDMHQLGKDPSYLGRPVVSHLVSGKSLDADAMRLYLHACTELLAVVGKLGQLYVQDFPDAAAVAAVDQHEGLASSLSSKIWQKLMILDRVQAGAVITPAVDARTAADPLPERELAAASQAVAPPRVTRS